MTTPHLGNDDFLEVVERTPLVALDLIIRSPRGEILVGKRVKPPARDTWFVPGGRIRKDESLEDAFRRISHEELGLTLSYAEASFVGRPFEHFYADNFAGRSGVTTHYVALALEISLDTEVPVDTLPTRVVDGDRAQHSEWKWLERAELLADPGVHAYAKGFF